MEQKKGIPQRFKPKDETGKTRNFTKKATIVWLATLPIYLADRFLGLLRILEKGYTIFEWLHEVISAVIFAIIFFLPIIIIFSILIKLMQKGVDKMVGDKESNT